MKLLHRRVSCQSGKDIIISKFINGYIDAKNRRLSDDRSYRMAVYANDHIGARIYTEGVYDKDNIDDLISVCAHLGINMLEATALDIGANIGNHAIQFAKFFGRVEAFEPNPHTFKLLEFNCSYWQNCFPHNFGLADTEGSLRMYECNGNYGASSVKYSHQATSTSDIVVMPLDNMSADVSNVRLIKIDVEGMEEEVLIGAKNIIRVHKPIIAFEQHLSDFTSQDVETKAIKLLRSMGYEIFWPRVPREKRPRFIRRLMNVFDFFSTRREVREIVSGERVPPPTVAYSMLLAIHRDNLNT